MPAFYHPGQALHGDRRCRSAHIRGNRSALPTLVVREGGYAIDAIGECLEAFLGAIASNDALKQ
jgi:acetoin utilization deacetylase AcuC-like enzyme